jgi:hypothetical protein
MEDQPVLYKRLLEQEEIDPLLALLESACEKTKGSFVTGERIFIEIDLVQFAPLVDRLSASLRDYFPDLELCRQARLYRHEHGEVRPHRDAPLDGICNYTCLIYLNAFEDGKLSVKQPRKQEEMLALEPEKKHKVFTFTPFPGYGVIFPKACLHWAEEVHERKDFLFLHLYSQAKLPK